MSTPKNSKSVSPDKGQNEGEEVGKLNPLLSAKDEAASASSESNSSKNSGINNNSEVVGDGLIIKKFKLTDCIIYCIFMCIFVAMVILGRSYNEYNYHVCNSIKEALEGDRTTKYFEEVGNVEDFWIYIIEEFIPNILIEEYDNGEEISDPKKRYYVAETNLLMGGFRIGQKRVAPQKCKVPNELKNSFHWCYPEYSTSASAKEDLVIDNATNFTVSWQNHHITQDSIWSGMISTYDGHGYVVDFRRNLTEALQRVQKLRAGRFIDEQTRAIFIDFNTYNPVYNLDTVARLVFEFPPTGGIWPYFEMKSWQFRVYYGRRGTMLFVVELLFWVMVVWYLTEEICEILSGCGCISGGIFNDYKSLCEYWKDTWNKVDILNILFFFMYGVTRSVIWVYMEEQINWELYDEKFYSMRYMQRIAQICSWIFMVNGFLLFLKLFKYFTFSPKMLFLFGIMKKAYVDICIFMVAFLIFIFGFALMGYIAFSSDVFTFRTFGKGIANLIQYLVTDMDVNILMDSNRWLGNVYYIVWSMIMILVLSNVFIAILCDAYSEVQKELKDVSVKTKTSFFGRFNWVTGSKVGQLDVDELKAGCKRNQDEGKKLLEEYCGDDALLDREKNQAMKKQLGENSKE